MPPDEVGGAQEGSQGLQVGDLCFLEALELALGWCPPSVTDAETQKVKLLLQKVTFVELDS